MWYYMIRSFDLEGQGTEALEGVLSDVGKDGWELASVLETKSGLTMIFKRPAAR